MPDLTDAPPAGFQKLSYQSGEIFILKFPSTIGVMWMSPEGHANCTPTHLSSAVPQAAVALQELKHLQPLYRSWVQT